jgi:Protein N-terminal asparagine amidohydrolase
MSNLTGSKNKVKTCLQREYVIKGDNSNIKYLGTGGMDTCIAIFIQNSYGESFLAHSDIGPTIPANRQLLWSDIFSKFTKKDQNFNVMLLGGYQPALTKGASLKN